MDTYGGPIARLWHKTARGARVPGPGPGPGPLDRARAMPRALGTMKRGIPVPGSRACSKGDTIAVASLLVTVLIKNHIHTKDGEVVRQFVCTSRRDGSM